MKKIGWLVVMLYGLFAGSSFGQSMSPGFSIEAVRGQPIPVSLNKMTNLVFPIALGPAIKVSRQVLAQKVGGVDNVIELKALHRNFPPTNLSVYGKDGRLYSFDLHYTEDSTALNFYIVNDSQRVHPIQLAGLPVDLETLELDAAILDHKKHFLHGSVSVERMRVRLNGIYLRDGLLWLVFRVTNHSLIGYQASYMHFSIEDRKKFKRTARQDLVLSPVYDSHPALIAGKASDTFAVAFDPFTVPEAKRLVVELAETSGGRTLVLDLSHKTILQARAAE